MNSSPQSNNGLADSHDRSTPSRRNGQTLQGCALCQSPIVDGQWFCRLLNDEAATMFCSPACALRYFKRSDSDKNGWGQDSYEAHFVINGELWS